ncbi:MAG: hypothetical protein JNK72_06120 [Myxococcales bacterium]|nr:hypothetical protein [Myxococcales bacterium]
MFHRRFIAFHLALSLAGCAEPEPAAVDAAGALGDAALDDLGAPDDDAASRCPARPEAPAAWRPGPSRGPQDDSLRVNHLQVEGTHNSYHLRPPRVIAEWDYAMEPLDVQLGQQGVRALELDLRWDATCERFRVFHLPGLDARSTCDAFVECLAVVRDWSHAHPGHHVLFVQLEPKDSWDAETAERRLVAMEREIVSVFHRDQIVTPGEVQGAAPSLRAAVTTRGWPTLGETRGRVLFFIDRSDSLREVYTHGGRDLAGRLAFIDAEHDAPYAAVRVLNNPAHAALAAALDANFLVRVFSWTAGAAPLTDQERDLAFASGAHIVSTDYPGAMARDGRPGIAVPDGAPSRCNPVTAPRGCAAAALEALGDAGR